MVIFDQGMGDSQYLYQKYLSGRGALFQRVDLLDVGDRVDVWDDTLAGDGEVGLDVLPGEGLTGVPGLVDGIGNTAWTGVVVGDGETPEVCISADCTRGRLSGVVDSLVDLCAVGNQGVGKERDAEVGVLQVDAGRTRVAVGVGL